MDVTVGKCDRDTIPLSYWIGTICMLVAVSLNFQASSAAQEEGNKTQHLAPWSKLSPSETIGPQKNIRYYEFQTKNGSLAYLCVLPLNDKDLKIAPFFNEKPATTSATAQNEGALVAVNGGFFNLSNCQSTSYIVIDGKSQCEPKENSALVNNPKLQPFLKTIFNRSELRILLDDKKHRSIQIAKHNEPLPKNERLESALQAGPQLLPILTDKAEAFVRTESGGVAKGTASSGVVVDSIGAHRLAARTACGATPDGHLMLISVANKRQSEYSAGVTLAQLADILRELGCDRAINFDGGTSTTMVVCSQKTDDSAQNPCQMKVVCGRTPETQIKSGLLIKVAN
jgi:exopolysaccharide biosynthesis protein